MYRACKCSAPSCARDGAIKLAETSVSAVSHAVNWNRPVLIFNWGICFWEIKSDCKFHRKMSYNIYTTRYSSSVFLFASKRGNYYWWVFEEGFRTFFLCSTCVVEYKIHNTRFYSVSAYKIDYITHVYIVLRLIK